MIDGDLNIGDNKINYFASVFILELQFCGLFEYLLVDFLTGKLGVKTIYKLNFNELIIFFIVSICVRFPVTLNIKC
jgi:hypothetical protein